MGFEQLEPCDVIYDPRQINDRLLLGLKGSMAGFGLGLLQQRAREVLERIVAQGHFVTANPVGYVRIEERTAFSESLGNIRMETPLNVTMPRLI